MSGAGRGGGYKWTVLVNTTIGTLMATIDTSIVLISLPAIFRGIGLNPLTTSNTGFAAGARCGSRCPLVYPSGLSPQHGHLTNRLTHFSRSGSRVRRLRHAVGCLSQLSRASEGLTAHQDP